MTIEKQQKRIWRLARLHEKVMDTARSEVMGEWFSDGSGSSVFLNFWKNWWVLWYNDPEKARKIHSHYMYCSRMLTEAKQAGVINPIFEPVWMHPENSRPYLVRAIPGKTLLAYLKENEMDKISLQNLFWKHIRPYLKNKLSELGFSDNQKKFDLKSENILINDVMWNIFAQPETVENIKLLNSKNWPARSTFFSSLLAQWYGKWGRIYLFDYGTWIKPDWTDKYWK